MTLSVGVAELMGLRMTCLGIHTFVRVSVRATRVHVIGPGFNAVVRRGFNGAVLVADVLVAAMVAVFVFVVVAVVGLSPISGSAVGQHGLVELAEAVHHTRQAAVLCVQLADLLFVTLVPPETYLVAPRYLVLVRLDVFRNLLGRMAVEVPYGTRAGAVGCRRGCRGGLVVERRADGICRLVWSGVLDCGVTRPSGRPRGGIIAVLVRGRRKGTSEVALGPLDGEILLEGRRHGGGGGCRPVAFRHGRRVAGSAIGIWRGGVLLLPLLLLRDSHQQLGRLAALVDGEYGTVPRVCGRGSDTPRQGYNADSCRGNSSTVGARWRGMELGYGLGDLGRRGGMLIGEVLELEGREARGLRSVSWHIEGG